MNPSGKFSKEEQERFNVAVDEFVSIPGYPNFEINKLGEVRHKINMRVKKQHLSKAGYPMLGISDASGWWTEAYVHRLLAITFIPNPHGLPTVNHKDGVKTNNSLGNLEWCSYHENNTHARRTGLCDNRGERNGTAKLRESEVIEIIGLLKSGKGQREIAEMFGVTRGCVQAIHRGLNWRYLQAQ